MNPQPIVSCIKLNPGPDVAVMLFHPAQLAPITAPIDASSSSICMNIPPTCGKRCERRSGISLEGDMGYPAKKRQPAVMAPSTQASLPDQKYLFDAIVFIYLPQLI